MRVLLIAIQYPPDVNSTGALMAELVRRWTAQGHEISVLTSLPHYREFRIEAKYRGRWFDRDAGSSGEIRRLWVYAPGKKSMLNRLVNYLTFAVGAALAGVLWRRRWDVILCTNGGFFSGIAAWLIGTVKRIPFVYNVQDLYPDVPVAAGQLSNRRAIAILKRLESFMYRKAQMVTVISTAMRDNLRVKGVPSDKLKLIANFADSDFITPLPRANPFSDALGLGGKFVVMHAGNLGYVYDLGGLLDAASRLNQLDDLRVIIVGDGVAKAALEEQVRRRQLSNVVILPFQPREQLPWLRATADVQVSLYKRGAARHSMPSKVYEIMASGRPLIASAESDSPVGRLIAETGCGRCVEPENGEALAAAIEALYCDRELCTRLGAQGRHHAVQNYSAAAVAAAYEKLLQELPSTSSSPSVPAPASPAGNRRWLSPKR